MLRFTLLILTMHLAYCSSPLDLSAPKGGKTSPIAAEPVERSSGCQILELNDPGWQRIWNDFVSSGFETYRLARKEDFTFNYGRVNAKYVVDLQNWVRCPVRNGYFSKDQTEDYAVFVVDTSKAGPEALRLVILTRPALDTGRPGSGIEVHWVEARDLSASYLSKSRAGLSIRTLTDEGEFAINSIVWDVRAGQYQCVRRDP